MSEETILAVIDERGVVTLTMNRPELHNAFDDRLIATLTDALRQLAADPAVRVLLLAASGKSFSAGADLNWMRRMADYSHEQNLADAAALAELMRTLDSLPKPTIALVQGAAYGGGVGLAACCDIVLATARASFCLSEVRLGLIPAVISPYVVAAIGSRAARRYFLTAETFDALEAQRIGLVHEVVADQDELTVVAERLTVQLLKNGPAALSAAKSLL
ncbi:MAG: enoyl-CoA hydratase/isomerase family protein, partial [Steroidobacteraceae bacterium]|nr:enoyl-CoA hydratase/isomerase family protein [Deltaproteobacteria bacterium]